MSNIININETLKRVQRNFWRLDYNDLYIYLNDKYSIRVVKLRGEVWFELDQIPLMTGCYLFSSKDLKEVFDWVFDNLKLDILYY